VIGRRSLILLCIYVCVLCCVFCVFSFFYNLSTFVVNKRIIMQLCKHYIISIRFSSHHHQLVGVMCHRQPIHVSASPRRYQVLFSKPSVRYVTFSCSIPIAQQQTCVPEKNRPPFYFSNNCQKLTDFNDFGA